jgi:topoisomerase-4 subunit A
MDSSGRSFVRSMAEVKDWIGDRTQAGRLPPQGFPRSNRFGTPGIG